MDWSRAVRGREIRARFSVRPDINDEQAREVPPNLQSDDGWRATADDLRKLGRDLLDAGAIRDSCRRVGHHIIRARRWPSNTASTALRGARQSPIKIGLIPIALSGASSP